MLEAVLCSGTNAADLPQCHPDGDKPCCNHWQIGECGNTPSHCTCDTCTDYRRLYRDWRESNRTQKWRYDGRCGRKYLLPDGSPSECDPDGDKPCCSRVSDFTSERFCRTYSNRNCLCTDCVDYRVVREIRNSGENCAVAKIHTGYLKHVCFDEEKKQLYYICSNSDVSYTFGYALSLMTKNLKNLLYFHVSKVCKNDTHAYQACGFNTQPTSTDVVCGGYFCGLKKHDEHKYIECTGDECKPKNRDCNTSSDETKICNDECEVDNCEDESYCNNFHYGLVCDSLYPFDPVLYIPVYKVCDGHGDCDRMEDEEWSKFSEPPDKVRISSNQSIDQSIRCSVKLRIHKSRMCTHYGAYASLKNEYLTAHINNYTRCSVFDLDMGIYPYCLNYLDQTNCSDIERVGGYCEVNGYMSTVSKYVLCYEYDPISKQSIKLCDDDFQNNCINPLDVSDCRVHKHWMCDGVNDCPDGTDEIHEKCKRMTDGLDFVCKRRFHNVKSNRTNGTRIPTSWILDNEVDCMNSEDENEARWELCLGDIKKVLLPGESCQNLFKCSNEVTADSVSFDHLCDGVESCGNGKENRICRIAKDLPRIRKNASITDDEVHDVCHDLGITEICKIKEFGGKWGPSKVFGVDRKILVNVPITQINCTNLFGEHYLFLSCMGLCSDKNTVCPLEYNNKIPYNSCPGQFPDRAITLAENSFLTFVTKSNRGYYHQEFYQCKNRRCVEYKQVCDLVDDCGDMSDEINCTNHMICEDTLNSTKHQFISFQQKCDGIYDCFDLSDECNESCSKQILGNWALKSICWIMGILAFVFNSVVIFHGLHSIKECRTGSMMTSKFLMSLIASGDQGAGKRPRQ